VRKLTIVVVFVGLLSFVAMDATKGGESARPVQKSPVRAVARMEKPQVANVPKVQVDRVVLSKWWKVSICEEGGKDVNGTVYGGYLGIRRTVWAQYGGLRDFGPEQSATFAENVVVAQRINGSYVPDQFGCSAW